MRRSILSVAAAWVVLAVRAVAGSDVVFLEQAVPAEQENPPAVQFWKETRIEPRPLAIYVLKVDLQNPRVEIVSAIAPDPDGAGPAESQLVSPLKLAESNRLTVAVNANAFKSLVDVKGKESTDWFEGMPVIIIGWAVNSDKLVNPPKLRHASLWMDRGEKAHIGDLAAAVPAHDAVSGFDQILGAGTILCGTNSPLHPRTSAGLDAAARFLWLAAVDGRQPGYSEGMTTYELAELMKSFGCRDAVNLDGGGSTIMLAADAAGHPQILNRPSDRNPQGEVSPRPVPVLLGVRLKDPALK